jgi:hypothetical protein
VKDLVSRGYIIAGTATKVGKPESVDCRQGAQVVRGSSRVLRASIDRGVEDVDRCRQLDALPMTRR